MLSNLIETVKHSDAKAKADALATYRALLLRADKPRKGDTEALRDAMAVLGIGPDRLERDAQAVRQAAHLERQAAEDTPELAAESASAADALNRHLEETERIRRERDEEARRLRSEWDALTERRRGADEARRKLAALHRERWELFGVPEPKPEPDPMPRFSTGDPGLTPWQVDEHNRQTARQHRSIDNAWIGPDGRPVCGPAPALESAD